MANVQYYDVILKPVITEKSMADMADKKYTFLVQIAVLICSSVKRLD